MKKKRIDALVESQREAFYKFLKSNTNTSRDPRALMIVAVDEPANTDLEDHNHMEDNVDIDMDEHNVSDHEHAFHSNKTESTIVDEDSILIFY